jgi:para-aminobenzoate synthetase/4-amino-4-deoxychorismate lyase
VLPLPVESHDFRLRHKTTDRAFYDRAREDSGCDEIVFLDGAGFVTEGSFTNVFVERDGKLVTPPLARGLLPGILRRKLLETGKAVEGDLTVEDLSAGFFIGNSLRGLVAATLAQQSVGETKEVCD